MANFMESLRDELYDTGRRYARIARKPTTLITGTFKVAKGVFYDVPKTFFERISDEELANPIVRNRSLNSKASAALALSEFVGYFGTFWGANLFSAFGASPYVAANIGGSVGNYISAASTFFITYGLATKKEHKSEGTNSFTTGLSYVAKIVPAALVSYATGAPITSGLVALHVSPDVAVTANTVFGSIVFMSAAKTVIDR